MKKLCIGKNIGKLWSCDSGAVAPLVGICAIMLVGAVAVAVDVGRGQVAQSKLQAALDSAGLAAGAVVGQSLNEAALETEAKKYLDQNFAGHTVDAEIDPEPNGFVLDLSDNKQLVTLSATATLPTTFMRIFGQNTMQVAARTEITRETKGLELAMVLDTSGSMANELGSTGISRIAGLRNASHDLIDILYGPESAIDELWIGVVPFSQAVNIGTSHAAWTVSDTNNWGPTSWAGCVEAREANGRDMTDDPPSVELFPKYYNACIPFFATWGNSWYGNNALNTATNPDTPADSNCQTSGASFGYRTPLSASRGPNQFCPAPITTMTHTKTTIEAAIDALAAGTGDTHVNIGMAWGWRLLSPSWKNLWGGEMDGADLPLEYNHPKMMKSAILVVDGAADGANHYVGKNYTAYGRLNADRLDTGYSDESTANSNAAVAELNVRTEAVCSSMKTQGVVLYTIALGGAIGSSHKEVIKNCASSDLFFFDTDDPEELKAIFKQIADSLSNLRVSQ